MKKFAALAAVSAFLVTPVMAEQLYSFGSASLNYLDWDDGSNDMPFLELEGGAGYTWGEVYGFVDFENPLKNYASTFAKGQVDFNLGEGNWMLHTHAVAGAADFDVNFADFFAGVAYKFSNESGAWFKPYLAARVTTDNFADYDGFNGYQFGFAWAYPMNIGNQSFTLSQWHETDFGRDSGYWADGNGMGHNGAISAWWNAYQSMQVGMQYRYVDHANAGGVGARYNDGWIATVKYNF